MKQQLKYFSFLLSAFSFLMLILSGCSGDNKAASKSMEQLQKENGIPVVVKNIVPQRFEKHLTFFGRFKGQRETIIGAMIGGRVEKIFFHPGDKVKKNAIIMQFPDDSPASSYYQTKSAYQNSQKNYERMKALLSKGEIAQAQYDGAETKYLVDKRNYETMKDMLKLRAPYDGTITELLVHEGDNVKKKTPLFQIARLNKMKIRVWLSEAERMQVRKGMKALATVNGEMYTGTVSELSMSVNPMKEAFYSDLLFDNSTHKILSGTMADVQIITYEKDKTYVLARNVVKKEGGKNYVFLANGQKAQKKYISILNENGSSLEIGSELKAGDPLIVKGISRLTDGIKIKVVK